MAIKWSAFWSQSGQMLKPCSVCGNMTYGRRFKKPVCGGCNVDAEREAGINPHLGYASVFAVRNALKAMAHRK